MFLADLLTMIPAVQTVPGIPVIAVRWILFVALVLITSVILRTKLRN